MKRAIAVAAALSVASGAFAAVVGSVTASYTGYTGASGAFAIVSPVASGNYGAGLMNFTKSGSTGVGNMLPAKYSGYCIDMLQGVTNGTWSVDDDLGDAPDPDQNPWHPMGDDDALLIAKLWKAYYSKTVDGVIDGGVDDNEAKSAFQLAIWNIIYDDDATVASGSFNVSSGNADARNQANAWLGTLAGLTAFQQDLYALTSGNRQDFVTVIPVPAAALLGLIGLGATAWAKRRAN